MRAGFVVLIGRSNAGKSTLINSLVGAKVAIVSPKPQTTRFAIHGVVHDPRGQIVFVDTPGVLERTRDAVSRTMSEHVNASLEDINALVYVADPTRPIGAEEKRAIKLIEPLTIPKILAINKIDEKGRFVDDYRSLAPKFNAVVEVSGLHATHLKVLIAKIFEFLPEGEPIYPEFQVTNLDERQRAAEIIREKVFIQTEREVPYAVAVEIEEMEQRETKAGKPMLYIKANILTLKEHHKKMLVGMGGRKIKEIGSAARKELELALQSPVFLDLEVVVDTNWPRRLL